MCIAALGAWLLCEALLIPRAAIASGTEKNISVGAFVNDISSVNVTTGEASFDMYLWIVSSEPFDAIDGFEIINGDGTARLVESKTRDDGKSYQLLRLSANTKQRYNLQDYPFDTQALTLKFDFDPSVQSSGAAVVADTNNSSIARDIILPGWKIDQFAVTATPEKYPTSWGEIINDPSNLTYPEFAVTVTIERETTVYLVRYFSVIIFAGFLATLGLFLKPNETTRISLGIGAYISLSASNLVIANKLPVTDSLNFSDHVILITGVIIIATVLYSLTVYHLYGKTPARAQTIDRIARIGFPLLWVGALAVTFSG